MYHNGYYNEAYNYLIDNIKAPVLSPNELPVIAVIVSILMRLHIFDEALHFCDVWLKKLNTNFPEHNSFNLVNRGLVEILNDIRTLLINNPNPTDKQIESVTL